jgi:TolB protein
MRKLIRLLFVALCAASPALPVGVSAQMRIDVSGVGATRYPIAVANFVTDSRVPRQIADVIRNDLVQSGAFRLVEQTGTLSESANIDFPALRSRGADAVLGGSVSRLADGRLDIRFQLSDPVRESAMGRSTLVVSEGDLRLAGHQIADYIYEKITGQKGIFATRIAFITKQNNVFRLTIADWDGENPSVALRSSEPIISPSWSPDGRRLAYVSFESQKPVVYVHSLSDAQRIAVANFRGSNSAPAWSPDGRSLAVALTRDGLSQIYLISSTGEGAPVRLTTSSGIDTEPVFTPDGRFIYFTSDRGGAPQIYRIPAAGGDVSRITFGSPYNVSPRVSPDGRTLAFISRRDSGLVLVVRDLANGSERVLSDGGREESPSFAPNSRWIMYATRSAGRDSLMAVSIDGRTKQRLSSDAADIREPTWGPFSR